MNITDTSQTGKRLIALLIDLTACYLVAIIVAAVISLIPIVNRVLFLNRLFSQQFILLLLFLCRDYFFCGRGIGKNLMGLQVVRAEGGLPISVMQSILRNLTLTAPMLLLALISFVPAKWLPTAVTEGFNILEAVYAIIVFPLESYLVYSRADSLRLGDKLAHTRIIESPTNFDNFFAQARQRP
jgi:RDD family